MNPDAGPARAGLVPLLAALAPVEGYTASVLPAVRFLRSDRPLARTPVLYEPGIVIVCQGRKRGWWAGREIVYDANHVLAVALPVPFTMETDASAAAPLLAVYLTLDFPVLAELVVQLDAIAGPPAAAPVGLLATAMDDRIADSVRRLLQALASPVDGPLLGPALVREIMLRVLTSEQGPALRAALAQRGRFGQVGRAIRRIHADYAARLDVPALAREAGMSVPSLHAHFRAATGSAPMQYLKSVRLHQARLLMLRQGRTAAAAAADVGYESASQFSREFKRLFGRSPGDEVARLRAGFALPAPAPSDAPAWVSSH